MIGRVRDVAATRAFMLRVAKKEGWNVAAGIKDLLEDDPMEVFFQEKLASARQSARNNRPRRDEKSEMLGASFLNMFGGMTPNPMMQWSIPGQQYFQQSGQPNFASGRMPTYGNIISYPNTYQFRYEYQRRPWSRLWATQSSPRSYIPNSPRRWGGNPGIVCFICEKRGHIAWDCPQKRSERPFHRTESEKERA